MFREDRANTGGTCRQLEFPAVVGGEEKKRSVRQYVFKGGGSFKAIHFRHSQIKDDEVGGKLLCFLNRIYAIDGFAANAELRMGSE